MPVLPALPNLTGPVIAADAQRYKGAGYTYGGNGSAPGDWDCSSFVSYVLGHDLGMVLPGGGKYGSPGYPPSSHGPVVTDYANWGGASPVNVPAAGDLCCWVGAGTAGHIGIAISGTQMISALNPSDGTTVTGIVGTGPSGSPLVYRRVVPGASGLPTPAQSMATRAPLLVALIIAGILASAAGVFVAAGILGGVGVAALIRKARG